VLQPHARWRARPRCDLLVVGGGPAASALAATAAARGARVVLLDRERFPRDKVCAEFLSAEGCAVLARLGLLDRLRAAGAVPMRACLLADARGRAVTSHLPDLPGAGREALGISRNVINETLLRHAASPGVDVREGEAATAPIDEDGRVRGAELALPFVLDGIEHGGLSETAARDWARTWRAAFAPVTRRVRLIGRVFRHPRPAAMAMSLLSLPHGARLLPSLVAATRTGGAR